MADLNSQLDGRHVLIKLEIKTNPRKDVMIYNPAHLYVTAMNTDKVAYHEIIRGDSPVRLYWDYDSKTTPFPVCKFE
jgi:hypothetical protein